MNSRKQIEKDSQLIEMLREEIAVDMHNADTARAALNIAHKYIVKCENQAKQLHNLQNKQKRLCPCDVCSYRPPSSMDGKPCTICPAG